MLALEMLGRGGPNGAVQGAARTAAPVIDGVVLDAHVIAVLALLRNLESPNHKKTQNLNLLQ